MYSIRDLLVFGPVIFVTLLFHDADWRLLLGVALVLYGALRILVEMTGLEQAVRDRSADRNAASVALRATRARDARSRPHSNGNGAPKEP